MKFIKKIIFILLVLMISIWGGSCMKSNDISSDEIKMGMLNYAENKYSTNFNVVDFEFAMRGLDSNYHDILTLVDNDGVQFNVYSNTDIDDKFDDYGMSCADKILNDYLKSTVDVELCSMIDLISNDQVMPQDIKGLYVSDFSNKYEINNITVIAKVNESELEAKMDEIYKLYNCVTSIQSENIDFEVVSVEGEDRKLDNLFNNIRADYENDWTQYSSVRHFITTNKKDLSQLQFELLVEEV